MCYTDILIKHVCLSSYSLLILIFDLNCYADILIKHVCLSSYSFSAFCLFLQVLTNSHCKKILASRELIELKTGLQYFLVEESARWVLKYFLNFPVGTEIFALILFQMNTLCTAILLLIDVIC